MDDYLVFAACLIKFGRHAFVAGVATDVCYYPGTHRTK